MTVLVRHKFSRTVADYNASLHGTSSGVTFPISRMQNEVLRITKIPPPTVYEAVFDGVSANAASGLKLVSETAVLMVCWYKPGNGGGIIFGQHDGVSSGIAIEQISTGTYNHQIRAKLNGLTTAAIDVDIGHYYCLIASYDAGTLDFYAGTRYDSLPTLVGSLSATVTWPDSVITFGDYDGGGAPCNCSIVEFLVTDDSLLTLLQAEVPTKTFPIPTDFTVVAHDSIEDFSVDYVTLSNIGTERRATPANTVVTYSSLEEAMDINGDTVNLYGHFVFDGLYAATDRWTWELELKIRSDPANRDHIGLGFSMAAAAYPMYNLYELDRNGFYGAQRFSNSTTNSSAPAVTMYGEKLNLLNGETKRLRVTYDGSAGNPAPCLHYLDGVLVASFNQVLDTYLTIPCLHYYRCAVQVNSSKYWADAVVPPHAVLATPPQIGAIPIRKNSNSGSGLNRKAAPNHITEGWSPALPAASAKAPIHPKALVQDGYNQIGLAGTEIPTQPQSYRSDKWIDTKWGASYIAGSNVTVGDHDRARFGKIEGVVTDDVDAPVGRLVLLFTHVGGLLVRETWSDPVTGAYLFMDLNMELDFMVVARDYTGTFNSIIAEKVSPELVPVVIP